MEWIRRSTHLALGPSRTNSCSSPGGGWAYCENMPRGDSDKPASDREETQSPADARIQPTLENVVRSGEAPNYRGGEAVRELW